MPMVLFYMQNARRLFSFSQISISSVFSDFSFHTKLSCYFGIESLARQWMLCFNEWHTNEKQNQKTDSNTVHKSNMLTFPSVPASIIRLECMCIPIVLMPSVFDLLSAAGWGTVFVCFSIKLSYLNTIEKVF